MNPEDTQISWWRFSLRELLLVIGFVAVACVSLKYAGLVWEIVLSTTALLFFMRAAVITAIDRGRPQSAAIGLVVCLSIYGGLLLALARERDHEHREFVLNAGRLPTSQALSAVFERIAQTTWVTPPIPPPASGPLQLPVAPPTQYPLFNPDSEHFMRVGHLLWAFLFGYLGSRLALFCYDRRTKRESQQSPVRQP